MNVGNKRPNALSLVPLLSGLWMWAMSPSVSAVESQSPSVLEKGRLEARGVAGSTVINREHHFYVDGSLRVGVGAGIEIASPSAIAIRFIGSETGGITVGLGVVDWYVSAGGRLLFEPMLMLAGMGCFGPEASFRAAVDVVGAEEGLQRGDHAFWLRGSFGVIFDLGRVASLAFGLAYQRILVDGAHPGALSKVGWAGDSRVSLGSVRTEPSGDLPLLSIHLQNALDFIVVTRFDINVAEKTSDIRFLAGFSLMLVSRKGP